MNDSEIVYLALSRRLPASWPRRGGADADMAGVLWTDSAGVTYVGTPEPTTQPIPDPCTWVEVPERELTG